MKPNRAEATKRPITAIEYKSKNHGGGCGQCDDDCTVKMWAGNLVVCHTTAWKIVEAVNQHELLLAVKGAALHVVEEYKCNLGDCEAKVPLRFMTALVDALAALEKVSQP